MKNKLFRLTRKTLSVLLTLIILLCALPAASIAAGAVDYVHGYKIKISIKTIDDADGWNKAWVKLYCKDNYGSGEEFEAKQWESIQGSIDEENKVWEKEYVPSDYLKRGFPTKVEVYTDFGGGMTYRVWQGTVKIYVNGVNIKNENIRANSGIFSSSNTTNTVMIDKSIYPYPDQLNVTTDNFGEFYQAEDAENCEGEAFVYAVDQYGVNHDPNFDYNDPTVTNLTDSTKDTAAFDGRAYYSDTGYGSRFKLSSSMNVDHSSTYKITYNSPNTAHPTITKNFEVDFIFRNQLDIVVKDDIVLTKKDFSGEKYIFEIDDFTPPTGYAISGFSKKGGGTLAFDDNTEKYTYTFGSSAATITAKLSPITYTIKYYGNDDDYSGGEPEEYEGIKYDKQIRLESNLFSKEGYSFTGWNTKPDGTGTAYAANAFVKNLCSVQDAVFKLYAQWELNVYDVELNYVDDDDNKIRPSETLKVAHGGSITVDDIIYADDENGHYQFVEASDDLDGIDYDIGEIDLIYEKVEHNYILEVTKEESCLNKQNGETKETCLDCGYVKTTVIPWTHQDVKTEKGYAPTCTEKGSTDRVYCAKCGDTITASTEIPANGHKLDTEVWTWSDDYTSANVKVYCSDCETEQRDLTASGNKITYTDSGCDRIYTASMDFTPQIGEVEHYENSTVRKNVYVPIPYIDENGAQQSVNAVSIGSFSDIPDSPAYYVDKVVNLSDTLSLSRDTKLILCDGAELSITVNGSLQTALDCSENTLSVYGQSIQSGKLNISSYALGILCRSYRQYGGKVSSVSRNSDALRAIKANIEIHRGTIEISASASNTYAARSTHGDIILGCDDCDSSIKASGYSANGAVKVKAGQTLKDESFKFYSGTLNSVDLEIIKGQKLTLATPLDDNYDPVINAANAAENDGNGFNLPSEYKYRKATLLGVQKKESVITDIAGSGLRFVAEISSEFVGRDDVDYGFEVAKTSKTSTKEFDSAGGFDKMSELEKSGSPNVRIVSCKNSTNNIVSEEYGNHNSTSTTYKYVTLAITDIPDNQGIAVRFYVKLDGKTYYASYRNDDGYFMDCCTSYDKLENTVK